jgi:hypothetical protein
MHTGHGSQRQRLARLLVEARQESNAIRRETRLPGRRNVLAGWTSLIRDLLSLFWTSVKDMTRNSPDRIKDTLLDLEWKRHKNRADARSPSDLPSPSSDRLTVAEVDDDVSCGE